MRVGYNWKCNKNSHIYSIVFWKKVKMENLKKIIESKKLKSSDKKPRYGTRKLSVGLVSCMLGYFVFMSPTVVNA